MKIKLKLKNQLVLLNALTKVIIFALLIFSIPWLVNRVSINDTDQNLIKNLDEVLALVDSLGINNFINKDAEFQAFGSYNILKDEYISIEILKKDTLINSIATSERIIENEVVNYRVLSYSVVYNNQNYLIEIGKSIAVILNFQKQMKRFAIILMIIMLGITIVIEVSSIQYLLRPLDFIVRKLKSTSHPTNFDYSEVKTNTSDFVYLEQTIHNLMHKIEETFNNEREYISNVSHELLTPISIIKSKLDNIIMEGNMSEEDMLKVFESKQTLGRLTNMVRTLLTLSRIENEEYLLRDEVEVIGLIKNVTSELEDRIAAKNLELKLNLNLTSFTIKGNQDLLFNLFYNLVNNAIKYTDEGYISVDSTTEQGKFQLVISDTGHGIDKEHLPFIFTRFRKFKTGKDNFGLGLALAKKISDYHGIQMTVESELEKGTRFIMQFPNPEND